MSNKKPQTQQEKKAMEEPYIHKRCPMTCKLVPGKEYLYCKCGLTSTEPFCDEKSCIGTKFQPLPFIAKNQTTSLICLCRRNDPNAGPYCDGTHSTLEW